MMRGRHASLRVRFFLAMILVAFVGGGTAVLVGLATAPGLFHRHLHEAMPEVSTAVVRHADSAFWSANALGLVFAVPVSSVVCVAASFYLSRGLRGAVRPLVAAAVDVAGGRYAVRVQSEGLGPEFADLIEAFNQMAARLQRAEESCRRLIADVTHELRTPLATLNAYVEALQDGVATLDAETGDIISAQVIRLSRLTDDMAAVSAVDEPDLSLNRQPTTVGELLQAAITAFSDRFARKGVVLTCTITAAIPLLNVDPDRVGQILANLLDNALSHTPPGGQVIIAAGPGVDCALLVVRDSGDGIAAADLPLIFDRFYRGDTARNRANGGGSGIGLAITQRLVEAHHGRIYVTSDGPGRGAAFTITLPQCP